MRACGRRWAPGPRCFTTGSGGRSPSWPRPASCCPRQEPSGGSASATCSPLRAPALARADEPLGGRGPCGWPGWKTRNWPGSASGSRTCARPAPATATATRSWPSPASRDPSTRRAPASCSGTRPRPMSWASGSAQSAAGPLTWTDTARPGLLTPGGDAGRHLRAVPTAAGCRWPARCWPSTRTPAPRPRTWSWPGSWPAWRLSTVPGRSQCRARPGRAPCWRRSAGARPRSAVEGQAGDRRPPGRALRACCWTPPGWTCSRWTR
jgi:hypothetical protein